MHPERRGAASDCGFLLWGPAQTTARHDGRAEADPSTSLGMTCRRGMPVRRGFRCLLILFSRTADCDLLRAAQLVQAAVCGAGPPRNALRQAERGGTHLVAGGASGAAVFAGVQPMSPSAWNRDHGDQIFYTLGFLEHLERAAWGDQRIEAFRSELSKAGQLALMEELGLPYPKARVIHRAAQAWRRPKGCAGRWWSSRTSADRLGREALRPHLAAGAASKLPPGIRTRWRWAWIRPRWCRSSSRRATRTSSAWRC